MKEQWKACLHGFYAVSNHGRLRRIKAAMGTHIGRPLSPGPNADGYLAICTSINNVPCKYMVHCLVAQAFHGDCPAGLEVHHIDGVKTNNHADNLEYITHLANMRHAYRQGKIKRRLTIPQSVVDRIVALRRSGETYQQISDATGVANSYCWGIANGRCRKERQI